MYLVPFSRYCLVNLKMARFPTPPLLVAPAQEKLLEFLDETYPAKNRGMNRGYRMVKIL